VFLQGVGGNGLGVFQTPDANWHGTGMAIVFLLFILFLFFVSSEMVEGHDHHCGLLSLGTDDDNDDGGDDPK
jgi:hypothetical protein